MGAAPASVRGRGADGADQLLVADGDLHNTLQRLGFGLYGKVGPLLGLAPTAGICAFQVAASAWWVRRFAFGPVEWLWRAVTYGRVRRDGQQAVASGP